MKTIFGYLWAAFTYFWFAFFLSTAGLLAILCFTFGNDALKRKAHWLPKYACKCILFFSGMRMRLVGEKLNADGQYIYVANHVNAIDIVYVRSIINTYLKILAKKELNRIPFMAFFARNMGIPIDRSSKADRQRGLKKMYDYLKNSGASILIYPEGKRNRTPEWLMPFKNGAFITAIENQLPIACITLKDIRKRMNPIKLTMYPGSVTAFVDIFETKGLSLTDMETLKGQVRAKMLGYLEG